METKMAKVPVTKKKTEMKNRVSTTKLTDKAMEQPRGKEPQKNAFEKKFGEGTAFDLDYGKLLIIGLCVYIAVQVS